MTLRGAAGGSGTGGEGSVGGVAAPPDRTGGGSLAEDPPAETPQPLREAMAAWRSFDVNASPRPVVMSGASTYIGGVDDSIAVNGGRGMASYRMSPELSFALPSRLPTAPKTSHGYPILGAREALAKLRRPGGQPVAVDSVRLGRARFWTDRGIQALPAWMVDVTYQPSGDGTPLSADGGPARDTAYVLAVAKPGRDTYDHRIARIGESRDDWSLSISRDGTTLFVRLVPGGSRNEGSVCEELDPAGLVETRTTVGLPLRNRQVADIKECGTFDPNARVEIHLSRPLGNRIVVTSAYGDYPTPVLGCDVAAARMHWSPCDPSPAAPAGQNSAAATVGTPYGAEFGPEPSTG